MDHLDGGDMQKIAPQIRPASQLHPPMHRYELMKYVLRPNVAKRVGRSLNAYLELDSAIATTLLLADCNVHALFVPSRP